MVLGQRHALSTAEETEAQGEEARAGALGICSLSTPPRPIPEKSPGCGCSLNRPVWARLIPGKGPQDTRKVVHPVAGLSGFIKLMR